MVPDGTALEFATSLAAQIAAFPQNCMLADRASVMNAVYGGANEHARLLQAEFDAGLWSFVHLVMVTGKKKGR